VKAIKQCESEVRFVGKFLIFFSQKEKKKEKKESKKKEKKRERKKKKKKGRKRKA